MQENSTVRKISLDLSTFASTTDDDDDDDDPNKPHPMLQYIRSSAVLASLTLRGSLQYNRNGEYSSISGRFLVAILANPHSTLANLKLLKDSNAPMESICRLLKETTSLESLHVALSDNYDDASLDLLPRALGLNQTLRRLMMETWRGYDILPECIWKLRLNPLQRLRHLHLARRNWDSDTNGSLFDEVAALLCESRTLCQLVLERFRLAHEDMAPLISGLLRSLSIALLSFRNVHFDRDASNLFVTYMQTQKSSSAHSLCSLEMQSSFPNVASLIAIPLHLKKSPGPTIGSSLQSLRVGELDDMAFFSTLGGSAANILIKSLHFGRVCDEALHLAHIPQLIHVQKLHLGTVHLLDKDYSIYSQELLVSLQENGSLESASLSCTTHPVAGGGTQINGFGGSRKSRLQVICERNRAISSLRAKPHSWLGADEADKTAFSLLPTLFEVAKHAKRMAPSALLSFLLMMDDVEHGSFSYSPRTKHTIQPERVKQSIGCAVQ
jgi:hypothetical protein